MRFVTRSDIRPRFEGKSVAVVGSGPSVLRNPVGLIDDYEVVVRVNNYGRYPETGYRTDVFYSFFGTSIRKTKEELVRDGVTLCMSKLPNADISDRLTGEETAWHRRNGKSIGLDYRPHYQRREGWWFCDTYVPSVEDFMVKFNLIGRHQPTTGFAAILDILSFSPKGVFLTGFDFFRSGVHNVDEQWAAKNHDDPIKHVPEAELSWLRSNWSTYPLSGDARLSGMIRESVAA